jgi:hypothetical protein
MGMRDVVGAWIALTMIGCGPSGPSEGSAGNGGVGGGAAALELTPIMYTPIEQPTAFLTDGSPIELVRAPQGGHVLMVGARIKHSDSDTVKMKARVRDAATGDLINERERTVVLEPVPDDPTTLENNRQTITQMVHVEMCPRPGAYDVYGRAIIVEIEAVELYSDFTEGATSVEVIPTCMATDPYFKGLCECECSADYQPAVCGGELG